MKKINLNWQTLVNYAMMANTAFGSQKEHFYLQAETIKLAHKPSNWPSQQFDCQIKDSLQVQRMLQEFSPVI